MAIRSGEDRIEEIRKAMHREVDKLLDTPRLISYRITFEAGVDMACTVTVEKAKFLTTENLSVCAIPFRREEIENEEDNNNDERRIETDIEDGN